MKKMIITATALLVAACVQAGSIDWAVSGIGAIKNQGGTNIGAGKTVYLVLAASQESIVSAILNGTFNTSTLGVLGTATTTPQSNVANIAAQSDQLTAGTSYSYSVLVFNTPYTGVEGSSDYYKFSSTRTAIANPDGDHTQNILFPASAFSSVGWNEYTVVPEPTSMALLALGVAAIGLRRKVRK